VIVLICLSLFVVVIMRQTYRAAGWGSYGT
jgi:hypothetical protein